MSSALSANLDHPPGLDSLRTAAAVRERCALVHRWVTEGRSRYFSLDESLLPRVADYVAETTRTAYPDLKIPYHSRWRHFSAGGIDRWRELAANIEGSSVERVRAAVDLVTVSVLLDAGAGEAWHYHEPTTGLRFARSEGLAVASLDMFRSGLFSSDANSPSRADNTALGKLEPKSLARQFQASEVNPLIGLEQRAELLRRLGNALAEHPALFGTAPARPGHLVDYFLSESSELSVSAPMVLATLLRALSSIWPSGLRLDGFPLGDAGRHPAARTTDVTDGIVPFHKLSQWLTYSLLEPLAAAGLRVRDIEGLTALPEYRNGGLLIDLGVVRPRDTFDLNALHEIQSEPIVEWRALTVALLDRVVEPVRAKLGLDASFTLPQLLEGGTWAAGRKIARTLRPPNGPPPISVAADGTVF